MKRYLLCMVVFCNLLLAAPGDSLRAIINVVETTNQVTKIEKALHEYVHIQGIAAEVAGRSAWRSASVKDRTAFTNWLKNNLLAYYADTIQNLARYKYSFVARPNSKRQVLRVHNPNGSVTDLVVFFQNVSGKWLIVDSSFNGISIVAQWRAKLGGKIKHSGLIGAIND